MRARANPDYLFNYVAVVVCCALRFVVRPGVLLCLCVGVLGRYCVVPRRLLLVTNLHPGGFFYGCFRLLRWQCFTVHYRVFSFSVRVRAAL